MYKNFRVLGFVFGAVFGAMCAGMAQAKEAELSIPVTKDFTHGSFTWNGGYGTSYLAWRILHKDGVVYFCGAIASGKHNQLRRHNREVLRKGYLKSNGKTLKRGLSFFTIAPAGTDILEARANCKPLSVKPDTKRRYHLKFDPFSVRL